MAHLNHPWIKLSLCLVALLVLCPRPLTAETIRKPAVAGSFYPKSAAALSAQIADLTWMAEKTDVALPPNATLKALILPHAGYIYSGPTAAHASKVLRRNQFQKVIIIGPDHRTGLTNCAVSDVSAYQTPLGKVFLHPDSRYLRQHYSHLFQPVRQSDDLEHSIEVQIPFLQEYLSDFELVPIVMGPGNSESYCHAIEDILDAKTLVVVSSDLSHYLPYAQAVKTDRETIRQILDLNIDQLSASHYSACGMIPIQVLTHLAIRHDWKPLLLHYSNSGDTAGPKDRVVGYTAIAYFGASIINPLKGSPHMEKEKGDILLQLARQTIASSLDHQSREPGELKKALSDEIFNARRGTFVTLKIDNHLRGCIGNLSGDKSIRDGVKDNAINAAFHDPRFPPISKDELEKIDIEISLLTEPQTLSFEDGEDLLSKLRPNIDGVIIRKGPYSATFLPQVWEQLPDKKSFLSHLCQKAGLPSDAWQRPGLDVMVYQVQYFEENH